MVETVSAVEETQSPHHVVDIPTVSIWTAAERGDLDSLLYYIQHSHDPVTLLNKRDPKTECTLLHLVVSHVSEPYQALKLLLSNGADPWTRNVYNVQVLHTLPLYCSYPRECYELLLGYPDLDINCRDGDSWTPLHYACRFSPSPLPIIELLVTNGADVNALDSSRKSPLFCLLANGDHVYALSYFI
ncbi:ankyrin, partial [Hesseltinella vesiculosa]